jgi:hypothetical protein
MQGSKIRLSPAEFELFSDAQVILTKNSIIQKTVGLLSEVQEVLLQSAPSFIQTASPSPKISKGENYKGLPYVILDYPRVANGHDLFFVRSMFWWGQFFSSTLQVSGTYRQQFEKKIAGGYEELKNRNYFAGVNTDPWVHHFEEDNYRKISSLSEEAFAVVLEESQHIKIAASWPLQEWDTAANKLVESWNLLTGLVT